MTQCQVCDGRAELFLCALCTNQLRDMFRGLPRWLEHLDEAACGQAKLNTPTRRTQRTRDLDGDAYADMGDPALLRRRFLAAGGINARAADLGHALRNSLTTWVRHLCETRGVTFQPPKTVGFAFIGPLRPEWSRLAPNYSPTPRTLALWLAEHVSAIACDEAAAECFSDIERSIKAIERTINRPVPPRDVGPCPTFDENGKQCDVWLFANRDAIEVTCYKCQTTHNIERLMEEFLNRAEHMPWTAPKIIEILQISGVTLPERTWRHWRKHGVVKPCAYQRADGRRIGITRVSDEDTPLFRLADVRSKLAAMPGRKALAG